MTNKGFFGELRRRQVIRAGVADAATACRLAQLAAIRLPTFGAPHWLLKALLKKYAKYQPATSGQE